MADAAIWQMVAAIGAAGSFGVLCLMAVRIWSGLPHFFDRWLAYRRAKAEEKAADWLRLRDHCNFLMEAEERCRVELNDVKSRLASLEGYMAGQGKASQEAAGVVALERLGRNGKKSSDD